MDFIEACVEEIALEGLDGITFQDLWLRLEGREPKFPLHLDEKSKPYIWRGIAKCQNIEFYELPEPRPPLVMWKRKDYYDEDNGMYFEPEQDIEDIYPIKLINENGVIGSCATFHTRINVTDKIRDADGRALMRYDDIINRWGVQFVMVANQTTRTRYLLDKNSNPSLVQLLTNIQYGMLERIGRGRHEGVVVSGRFSLNVFAESSSSMFYHRKVLLTHNLIKKQTFTMRKPLGITSAPTHVMLLHLRRFFSEYKSKVTVMVERLAQLLMAAPNRTMIVQDLRDELKTTKKIFQCASVHGYFKKGELPISALYPDISNEEKYMKQGSERQVRVLKLVKTYKPDEIDMGEEDDQDETEAVENMDLVLDEPIMNQAYRFIEKCGPEGCSIGKLRSALDVGPLDARMIMGHILQRGVVKRYLKDLGKQRVSHYVALVHERDCKLHKDMVEHKSVVENFMQKSAKEEPVEAGDGLTIMEVDIVPSASGSEPAEVCATTEFSITEGHESQTAKKSVVTSRKIARIKTILDTIEEQGVTDKVHLLKMISEDELKRKTGMKMCRKSLTRLVQELATDGHIRIIKTFITVGKKETTVEFVCQSSITPDDQRITSALHRIKKKMQQQVNAIKPGPKEEAEQEDSLNFPSTPIGKTTKLEGEPVKIIYQQGIGRYYGLVPKMRRLELLHKYLFYLSRGYQGMIPEGETAHQLFIDQSHRDVPKVFYPEMDWRRFLPPMPIHPTYEAEGWFYFSDVLTVLPIVLLGQLVNLPYVIEEFRQYLEDPVKRFYPLCCIPTSLYAQVTYKRKYVFIIHELMKNLCYQGLLTFGPHSVVIKEKCFAHVHSKATLFDTSTSKPGYLRISADKEYPEKNYVFETNGDVITYWTDLEYIAINTPLGVRSAKASEDEMLKEFDYRRLHLSEDLQNSLKRKKPGEIVDEGYLPGDRMGAACLDTIFFNHRAQNWSWPYLRENKTKKYQRTTPQVKTATLVKKLRERSKGLRKGKAGALKKGREGGKETGDETGEGGVIQTKLTKEKARRGGKGVKRKAARNAGEEPAVKIRRQVPDIARKVKRSSRWTEGDQEALNLMTKERVTWTSQEDSLLLLMKVANIFLGRYTHSLLPWWALRDILHETFPEVSRDKTAPACQRRSNFIMKIDDTRMTVNMCAQQALLDKSLVKEFKQGKVYMIPQVNENIVAFKRLLEKLKEKIQGGFLGHSELPSSLKELHEKYEIIIGNDPLVKKSEHKDITSVREIHESTLHNVIHACLVTNDKNSRSQELYKLFQQYPENMLTGILSRMVKDQIIIRKKKRTKLTARYVHMTAMSSYMISQRYTYAFLYLSSYPRDIFPTAREMYQDLVGRQQRALNNDGDGFRSLLPMPLGGHAAMVVSLFALKKIIFDATIPEHITVVDEATLSMKKPDRPAKMKKSLQLTESDEEEEEMLEEVEKAGAEAGDKSAEKDIQKIGEEFYTADEVDDGEKSILRDAYLDRVVPEQAGETSSVAELLETLSKGGAPAAESSQPAPAVNKRPQLTESRYLISLARAKSHGNVHLLNPSDVIVLKTCDIKARLKKDLNEGEVPCDYVDPQITKEILRSLSELHPHETDYQGFLTECKTTSHLSDDEVIQVDQLHRKIESAREFGLTRKEVVDYEPNIESLDRRLNILMKRKIVTRSGVTIPRYISYLHIRPWLIHSYKTLRGRCMKPFQEAFKDYDKPITLDDGAKGPTSTAETPQPSSSRSSSKVVDAGQSQDEPMDVTPASEGVTPMETEQPLDQLDEDVTKADDSTSDLSNLGRKQRNPKTVSPEGKPSALMEGTYERVRVLCRPWIKPEGHVNRPTLKMMLEALLMYIMNNPGINSKGLFKKFNPILQPMGILELLEMLEKTQCITKMLLRQPRSPSLFSPRPVCPVAKEDDGQVVAAYMPAADCIIRLGEFLSQLETVQI